MFHYDNESTYAVLFQLFKSKDLRCSDVMSVSTTSKYMWEVASRALHDVLRRESRLAIWKSGGMLAFEQYLIMVRLNNVSDGKRATVRLNQFLRVDFTYTPSETLLSCTIEQDSIVKGTIQVTLAGDRVTPHKDSGQCPSILELIKKTFPELYVVPPLAIEEVN